MRESDFGSLISVEMRKRGLTVFKLHNDRMQRGLLDYIFWGPYSTSQMFELKLAPDIISAINGLSAGQESIMRSLCRSPSGALLVFGTERSCGAARLIGHYPACVKKVLDTIGQWKIEAKNKTNAARIIADLLRHGKHFDSRLLEVKTGA